MIDKGSPHCPCQESIMDACYRWDDKVQHICDCYDYAHGGEVPS